MQAANQQKGIALIVGLVLLIALTLIGVTAVKLTTLDERIAANNQYKKITFQAAESALAEAATVERIRDGNFTISTQYPAGLREENDPVVDAKVELLSERDIPYEGASIGEGNASTFKLRVFNLQATSEIKNVNAKAVHNLGVGSIVRP